MDNFANYLKIIENFLWFYAGIFFILIAGIYLLIYSKFQCLFKFHKSFYNFAQLFKPNAVQNIRGVHPLEVFFASLGGCIGLGNISSIAVAVQVGGPGALFWVWIAAFLGMILKYSEVYLGLKFRIENNAGSYDGGPMFFLRYAFPSFPIIANISALLMCFYGADIYLFNVMKESLVENFSLSSNFVIAALLILIISSVIGGIKRVGIINAWLIPIFILFFLGMTTYIMILNYQQIPIIMKNVFSYAFNNHAIAGGFLGSSLLMTISSGVTSACYSGDIGIGYASIIHSETRIKNNTNQASISLITIFFDTMIICTAVIFLLLLTNTWQDNGLKGVLLVQKALSQYFPYMQIFMPIFIVILGFSTIIAYMCASVKSAQFLCPKYGKLLFLIFSSIFFIFFSFFDASIALSVMYICGGLLMIINIVAIIVLRKYIDFKF
mgnify:CR=1 FL=1